MRQDGWVGGGAPSYKKGELDKEVVKRKLRKGITFKMYVNKTNKNIKKKKTLVAFVSFLS